MNFRRLSDNILMPGMRVLVRADFDVALDGGIIADASRIEAVLPTVRFLLEHKAKVRLIAHLGRPDGVRRDGFGLAPVARFLSSALKRDVSLVADPFGSDLPDADIMLFENLRFWPGEEGNDPAFASALAVHGDIYVNEAFAAYRGHASVVLLPRLLPAYAGFHLVQEVEALEHVLERPEHPFVAVLGGAKIETKLPLILRFLRDADAVIVGGALANTIFALRGNTIGKSRADMTNIDDLSFLASPKLVLPSDVLVAPRLAAGASPTPRQIGEVRDDEYIADIGPETVRGCVALLKDAKTIVWNGPLGYAEVPEFSGGSRALADVILASGGFTVVGGGDTLALLARYDIPKTFTHVSTGGGAMLAFLAGEPLPGLVALVATRG